MTNEETLAMENEKLRAEVKAWTDAAFAACGAWEPGQLTEAIKDKDEEIQYFRVNLAKAREQILKLKPFTA